MQTALLRSLTNIIPVNCNNILCGQGADAVFGLSYQMEFLSGIRPDILHTGPGHNFLLDYLGVDLCAVQAHRKEFIESLNVKLALIDVISCFDIAGGMAATQSEWTQVLARQGHHLIYPYLSRDLRVYTIGSDANKKFLETKYILRQAARKMGIPEWIITRSKASFGPTCSDWEEYLLPLFSILPNTFKEEVVRAASQNHDARYILWNMLTYTIWRELFIEERNPVAILRDVQSIYRRTP